MLIQVGSAETLLDDAVRFAARRAAPASPDVEDLAAHDPCLAAVERAARGRAQGAGAGRGVHAPLTMERNDCRKEARKGLVMGDSVSMPFSCGFITFEAPSA